MDDTLNKPQLAMAVNNLSNDASQIIREEIPILRDLLGLTLRTSSFVAGSSPEIIAQSASIKDVLFLAIDMEGETCQPDLPQSFQLGISILDTRDLQSLITKRSQSTWSDNDDCDEDFDSILKTYNLCYGSPSYCFRVWEKFLFGDAEEVAAIEMNDRIQTLIEGRDVVLVVHGGVNDLRFLDRLMISIKPLVTLDTQKTARDPLRLAKDPSLEFFLTTFEIPFTRQSLHIGGNDANYTLRSLLMIAVIDSEGKEGLSGGQLALIEALQGIARSPIPEDRLRKSEVIQGKGRLGRIEAKRNKKERKALRKAARANGIEES